jgi:hypothetical protein
MFKRDRRGRKQVLYVDKGTCRVATDVVEAVLTRLNIESPKLPPNSTHLTQLVTALSSKISKRGGAPSGTITRIRWSQKVSSKCRDRIRLEISRIPVAASS